MTDWQTFVLEHGRNVRSQHLAAIVGQPVDAIDQFRGRVRPKPGVVRGFLELFALWHGRPPRDDEWPKPMRVGGRGTTGRVSYEWLGPERALLARLVGTMSTDAIAQVLTNRLREITGDPDARRSRNAVLVGLQKVGLQTSDVVGGITLHEAAKEIGARAILYHEIRMGRLPSFKVGRHLAIPRDAFDAWKATRVFPPKGFIRLARLKKPLGILSDKLSEWARAGFVPSALRCTPYGTSEMSTRWGTWYINPKVAKKLIADRRAGRPMPWWNKPEPYNLKVTWRNWQQRRHPEACATCQDIWGPDGAPSTFEDYAKRYPPLAHGAKRHLTRVWSPGLRIAEVAKDAGTAEATVIRAIHMGVLRAQKYQGRIYVTRTDATRWKARRCPHGGSFRSWLSVRTACRAYGFTRAELLRHVKSGRIAMKVGDHGPMRDVQYVVKQQVRELRDAIGFSECEAARRVGVSIARLRTLLRGLEWRTADRIPFDVVNAARKREESENGVPLAEAAKILGKPVHWVREQIKAGTIRPLRSKWDKKRLYVTLPMFDRLCTAALRPQVRKRWTTDWMLLSDAAQLAGVSATQVIRWAEARECQRRKHPDTYWRYHRRSLLARARRYWQSENRFKRATPPAWLQEDRAA
jgi:hypothetical protein